MRTFYFHYNKPNDMVSVHFHNKCHLVSTLTVNVPCTSHFQKVQPRFIMKGKGKEFIVGEDSITIN